MKIFQVIQKPQKRGAELFAVQLSEELSRSGHEVILVSVFVGSEDLSFSGIQVHLNRPLKARLWDWIGWRRFADLVSKEKPDIIQANAADTLKFTVFSRLVFGWKSPLVFRNASQMSRYISNPWIKFFNQFLLNQVEGIASVSRISHEDLGAFFKLRKPKLEIVPIGVDAESLTLCQNRKETKQLIHIGGFTFEKNHSALIDIFQDLLKIDNDFHLILIGDGPLKTQIEKQVNARGLGAKVDFLGNATQPFLHISQNAILLLPSKIEGLPAVILEAMVCRIPVIAYDVGGIPELLKTGETGWCITLNDSYSFLSAIQEVSCMDQSMKKKILDQAYQQVTQHYTLPKVALQFEKFYNSQIFRN